MSNIIQINYVGLKITMCMHSWGRRTKRYKRSKYTMEYYSAIKRNTFESVLMRWMSLEPIIQSKVSQKEKYHILTHIYKI